MSNTPQDDQNQSGTADWRLQTRRRVARLAYIDLDGANGGIILNIGEDGLEVAAAGPVAHGPLPRMRFQMPDSSDWVEASGEIAWVGKTKREAGIQFVNLPVEARDRIRNWVSTETPPVESESQTCRNCEEKKQPPVPLSAQAPVRSVPRFTALSAKSQEEIPAVASAAKTDASLIGTEALAAGPAPDQEQSLSENPCHPWDSVVDADRRHHVRRRLLSLAYIELGGNNGGIILNISEGGLVVAVAAPVKEGALPKLRFQLPGSNDCIEASGEITWISSSKREVGIRFVELSPDTRDRIKGWVASEEIPAQPQAERLREAERPRRVLAMPDLRPSRNIPIPPVSSEPIIQVRTPISALNARASATLEGATVRVGVPSTSAPSPRQSTDEEVKPSVAAPERPLRGAAPWQNWSSVAAMVIAVGFVSFLVGWFTAGRSAQNKMLAALKGTTAESTRQIVTEKPQAVGNAANALSASAPKVEAQEPAANLPSVRTNVSVPSTTISIAAPKAQITKPAPAIAAQRVPTSSSAASAPEQEPKAQASPVNNGGGISSFQVVSAPPQSASAISIQPKEVASAAPSPKVNPSVPERPIEVSNKESPPSPKPIENPDVIKGSVSVSFSPYPSIRIPAALRSQMAKQGASLQIGQLVSRVDPVYPEDAEKNHIEGTVKVHVIIGSDGAVQNAAVIGGPDSLGPAAVSAARQWRYKPATVAGQAVEAEQDLTFVFRLVKQPSHSN